MRVLLDANLSGPRIGGPLRAAGYDVLALSEQPELEGLSDPEVLALAVEEGRILITRNSRDFAPLLREWARAGCRHSGYILIWTLSHHQFSEILNAVTRLLKERPKHADWLDLAIAI